MTTISRLLRRPATAVQPAPVRVASWLAQRGVSGYRVLPVSEPDCDSSPVTHRARPDTKRARWRR